MAWKGCTRLAYGGAPLQSSMAVMPVLHTSAQPSYAGWLITCTREQGNKQYRQPPSAWGIRDNLRTSGAIQNGVPTFV